MKSRLIIAAALTASLFSVTASAQNLKLNDLDYFEDRGINFLVYSNDYNGMFCDEKTAAIEIIQRGVRIATGGGIRLMNTPEQWDIYPVLETRNVDKANNSIDVVLNYADYNFKPTIKVTPKGKGVSMAVYLDAPVPENLEGKAGMNIEFFPATYFGKTFMMDGKPEILPRHPAGSTSMHPNSEKVTQIYGLSTFNDRGRDEFIVAAPIATGHTLVLAPEDDDIRVTFKSDDEINLFDGRNLSPNGTFVVRTFLPAGKTGKVAEWYVEMAYDPEWVREPNIGFSQVGYQPDQPKIAVIELDKIAKVQPTASLIKIADDGSEKTAFTGKVSEWGRYYKYNYVKFDFSEVTEPGFYYIKYGDTKTNNFIIGNDVYEKITDATSDVWIPIHMNHMTVNEAYRIWHGEPFKEGYLQAPENTDHFDLHSQGVLDAGYKGLQLIPGLNVGGYFDAGDFDIETGSNISVVQSLVTLWEQFHPDRDETFVSEQQRYVDLHRPDGIPDVLQYIEHGVLNLVAQAEKIGHMSQALSNSVLDNYHHLGDAAAITDGRHYDPSLKPYEVSADGLRSGTPDDMWAFTTRNPGLDSRAANMFAAASRVLRGYNDVLADRALAQSKRLSKESEALIAEMMKNNANNGRPGRQMGNDLGTNLQLFIATGDQSYIDKFNEQVWQSLDRNVNSAISTAMDAIPYMDAAYKEKLIPYVEKYKEYLDSFEEDNPYGVPIGLGNWAGSGSVVSFGTTASFASIYFPEIIDKSYAYKAVNYLFGCHPYHNYSLVATVGAARPKSVFYGNNRADFSFIPGNVAPGVLFRHPDHFENYDDWPFLWGQNEGTIAGNTSYLIMGSAFKNLVK